MDPALLLELYKLAHAEYRAEVALGWDRQKLFLTLNLTLLAIVGALGPGDKLAASVAVGAAAAVSFAGIFVVRRSHGRYQATRRQLDALAAELGITSFETTGGQREAHGKPRAEGFRVVTIMTVVLVVFALLDVLLAISWLL